MVAKTCEWIHQEIASMLNPLRLIAGREVAMYQRVQDAEMEALLEKFSLELESEFEAESAPQSYYYWEAWHRPGSQWQRKQQTSATQFTSAGANNRQMEFLQQWFKTLRISGGWLYIARFIMEWAELE